MHERIAGNSAPLRLVVAGILLAALSVTVLATTLGPDNFGYTATDVTTFSFLDVTASGASVLTNTDDGTHALTLPFSFDFYGTTYQGLCVSTNGAAYFVASLDDCGAIDDDINADLSSTAPSGDRPGLFPFWSDLNFNVPGAGGVYYQSQGSVGSRKFIIQWANGYPQSAASGGISPNPVTFQVVLLEGSNQILFQYQTVALGAGNPASNGGQASIGIRAAGGQLSGNRIAWSTNSPVVTDSTAILFKGPGKLSPFISVTGGAFSYSGSPHSGTGVAYGAGGLADVLSPAMTFSYQGNAPTVYGPTPTAPTAVGNYTVTGSFAGNTGYTSGSDTALLSINLSTQAIAFTSSAPASPTVGGPTYNVTATGGGSGNPIAFSGASPSVCTVSTSTVSFVGVGTCTIHADQAGDATYAAAPQATQSFGVGQGTQTITFTSIAPASPTVGGPTYVVTATGGASGNAVTFSSLTTPVCTVSGSTVTFGAAGSCEVAANQLGSANYLAATQVTQQMTVLAVGAATTTAFASNPNPSELGQNVTFTATVKRTSNNSLVTSGTVTFKEGSTILGGPTALNGQGKASLATSSLSVGNHTIMAVYNGNGSFATSNASLVQITNKISTKTDISSSIKPSEFSDAVTFTAVVHHGPSAVGGTVTFKEGAAVLAANMPLNGLGVASFSTSSLSVGSHTISAFYNGTDAYATSNDSLTQDVKKASTTTSLVSSINPSNKNQNVVFTATVTHAGNAVTTGTVTFKEGKTVLAGPTAVNGSGTASFSKSDLKSGKHDITAVYNGTSNYQTSSDMEPQTIRP